MNRLHAAIQAISTAREYTDQLLARTDPAEWFRQPQEGVTHIAWQVGHLAFAEYAIGLRRIRGVRDEDGTLFPEEFHNLFGRLSVPDPDPGNYPSAAEIRRTFDAVHKQVLRELPDLSDKDLDESTTDPPHPMHSTKWEALQWCAQHEFLHAGEIALLRRLHGAQAIW